MIPGIVCFQHHHVGGWRVKKALLSDHLYRTPKVIRAANCLYIVGNFNRRLRAGTWCKRPHKELAR